MITANLRVNQLSAAAYARYLAYLESIDGKDLAACGRFLADDATMRMGNGPSVVGRDAIVEMLREYWQTFASIEHDLKNIYGEDHNYVLEAANHYVRHDGRKVTVEAAAFTDLDESLLVRSARVFGDVSPVFAPA